MSTATTEVTGIRVRFPGLDAIRALGATAVVATHVGFQTGRSNAGPFAATLARLDIGVALFFVLSGFLLFRPYAVAAMVGAAEGPRLAPYLWRRALRILPAYWIVVAASLLLIPANQGLRGPSTWLRHVTLTQIYGLGLQRHGLTQTWSLCTEIAFYLLLPLLARLVLSRTERGSLLLLGVLAAASIGWQLLITTPNVLDARDADQWLPGYLDWFAGGMLLALLQVGAVRTRWAQNLQELARSPGSCWAAALAVFAIATSELAGPRGLQGSPTSWNAVLKNVLYLLTALLVVMPLTLAPHSNNAAVRLLSRRPFALLGELSYGIFLWHLLILATLVRVLDLPLFTGSWVVVFTLTWSLSVAVAYVSYRVLERPTMRLRRLVPERRPTVRPDQVTASAVTQSA